MRERVQDVTDWLQGPVYRDMVSPSALKREGPDALKERALMLRPTARRRGETIYVVNMACFALSALDLANALAIAHERRATVVSVDDDLIVPPGATPDIIAKALGAFDLSRRRQQTAVGRPKGVEVAAQRRRKATAAAIEKVRADWRRPTTEISTGDIAEKAGVTVKTLYAKLGRRSEAQKSADRQRKRKAAKT